ncbi:MAG: hypothetical protein ACR2M4_09055 [Actinomycetota bacterium]
MTTKNLTAIRPAESKSDDFAKLMHRFLLATERLQLAAHALVRGEDYGPASCVVEEATEALEQLPRDLEHWERDHRHAPEAKEVQS